MRNRLTCEHRFKPRLDWEDRDTPYIVVPRDEVEWHRSIARESRFEGAVVLIVPICRRVSITFQ
jgi:hypothetical protein